MNAALTADTYWVCVDCYWAAAHGRDEVDATEERRAELCATLPAGQVVTGTTTHDESCPASIGQTVTDDECDCDRVPFTSMPCEGCRSALAGERHAVTVLSSPVFGGAR